MAKRKEGMLFDTEYRRDCSEEKKHWMKFSGMAKLELTS